MRTPRFFGMQPRMPAPLQWPVSSPAGAPRSKRYAGFTLAFSLGLFALALLWADPRQVLARVAGVDLRWFWATFLLSLVQLALLGLRWSWIAQSLQLQLGWHHATREYALSLAVNQVLPTGYLGDGLRAVRHMRAHQPPHAWRALESLAADRASSQLGLLLVAGLSLPVAWQAGALSWTSGTSTHGLAVAGGLLLAGVGVVFGLGQRFGGARLGALRDFLVRTLRVLLRPRALLIHLPLSVALVATLLLQLYFAGRAIGVILPWALLFGLGPWILLASSLPSFLGGWGPREAAGAALFVAAGADSTTAVAVCVVFGAFALLVSLPGLFVLLLDLRGEGASDARLWLGQYWDVAHATLMLIVAAFALWVKDLYFLAAAAALSSLVFVRQAREQWTPQGTFGLANQVTALRLLITLALLALHERLTGFSVAAVALVVLGLDVLDGWLARRHATTSDFGGRFDVEADALLVLGLSLLLSVRDLTGPWVAIAGSWRYVFVLAPLLFPTPVREVPRSVYGRIAYVTLIVCLMAAFVVPAYASALAACGTLAVSASFLFSFWLRYAPRGAQSS